MQYPLSKGGLSCRETKALDWLTIFANRHVVLARRASASVVEDGEIQFSHKGRQLMQANVASISVVRLGFDPMPRCVRT